MRFLFFIFLLSYATTWGKIIFVDNKLSGLRLDSTHIQQSGDFVKKIFSTDSYNKYTRSSSGGNDKAYSNTLDAIIAVSPGDTIYIRNGVYNETYLYIDYKIYSENKQVWMMSYPGEWAILKGWRMHRASTNVNGGQIKYWNFSNFEVDSGSLSFGAPSHLTFRYLYVHDSPRGTGNDVYYGGGLCFWNRNTAPQNILVEYCYFKNNWNSNINFFSDYSYNPSIVKSSTAQKCNEIRYCYLEGSKHGILHKNNEFLCRDHTGEDMEYKELGDKIHHNIFVKVADHMVFAQDFMQIYNNVFDECVVHISQRFNSRREAFHVFCYNNLFLNSSLTVNHTNHSDNRSYVVNKSNRRLLNPYFYCYNNIFEGHNTKEQCHYPLDLLYTFHHEWNYKSIDWNTVFIDRNFFSGLAKTYPVFRAGDSPDIFNSTQMQVDFGFETRSTDRNIISENYSIDHSLAISDNNNLGNWGRNSSHEYISTVDIPNYLGHYEPGNNWVNQVFALETLANPGTVPTPFDPPVRINKPDDMINKNKLKNISGRYFNLQGRLVYPSRIHNKSGAIKKHNSNGIYLLNSDKFNDQNKNPSVTLF